MSELRIVGAAALGALLLSGCATQDYVDQRLDAMQAQVDGLQAQGRDHEARLTALERNGREALERARGAGRLSRGRFDYSVVLSDDDTRFPTDGWTLSDWARRRLADFAARLKSENRNAYLEIQGYTDDTGAPDWNYSLGWHRAEAVRLFLNERGVPLNRMASISYGQSRPVASNDTPEGRARNRRVVLIVLE